MKAYCLLLLAATWALGWQAGWATAGETGWKIDKLSVTPVKEGVNLLTASVFRASDSQRVELSDLVKSREIIEAFVWRDELVLFGRAVNPAVVEIFDLGRRAKVDWFYCFQPRRVADNWIAYKEFYFGQAQGPVVPNEVLLVYDLTRTPLENRLDREPGWKTPPPLDDYSDNVVQVGIPILPESNARERSYQITFETQNPGRFIDGATIALLPSRKLVFRCSEQRPRMGVIDSREYLAVVDLSRGLENPAYKTVDIPRMGEFATRIERIEADTPHTVRLVFPKGEYGVESMVVALPEF
jgi:hypothetical protein